MKRLLALVASTSFVFAGLVAITAAPAAAQFPGDCHDASGNDIPCPDPTATSGFADPEAAKAAARAEANATETAARNEANANEATTRSQGAATEEASRQQGIDTEVRSRTQSEAGKECVREFRALSKINRASFDEAQDAFNSFSGSLDPLRSETAFTDFAHDEAVFNEQQAAIQANLFACLANAESAPSV